MNKFINVENKTLSKALLANGGEYRRGLLDAYLQLGLIKRCKKCGRLFYPSHENRSICGKHGCQSAPSKRTLYHRVDMFSEIVRKLRYRANNGDKDGEMILRNFLNSYALCETAKERNEIVSLWLSEYPSLRPQKREGAKYG